MGRRRGTLARASRYSRSWRERIEPFYDNLETICSLHALGAPETARLILLMVARGPTDTYDVEGSGDLLSMAIALHQRGDRD